MAKKTNIKKIILTGVVFMAVFGLANVAKIKAAATDNATGWLYGGSDDGAGNSSGVGWISMNSTNTSSPIPYGVNIPTTDGNLSGYAWSQNLGWIAFDNSNGYLNGCPDGNCVAKRVGNSLQGWARFTSIADASAVGNSGGWLGWIKLNGPLYNVSIDTTTGKLSGYAWSDELGTISFRGNVGTGIEYGAQIPLPPAPPTCVPNYQNYQCEFQSTGTSCNASNAGQLIVTGTPYCTAQDLNNCNQSQTLTTTECDSHSAPCDTNQTTICPQLKQATGWQEVAP